MLNMFNIIETLRNYFTCKLLLENLSSEVALHFNVSYWRPYLVVSCSEEVFLPASAAIPVCHYTSVTKQYKLVSDALHYSMA